RRGLPASVVRAGGGGECGRPHLARLRSAHCGVREELVRRALATGGPTTANDLATHLWMAIADVESKLASLEAKGSVLGGHFTTRRADDVAAAHSARAKEQWCDRYVLERIHRQTL